MLILKEIRTLFSSDYRRQAFRVGVMETEFNFKLYHKCSLLIFGVSTLINFFVSNY